MTTLQPIVHADDLSIRYRSKDVRSRFLAVSGVSFTIGEGEIVGLVGESGSGKSTLAATMAMAGSAGAPDTVAPEICGGSLTQFGVQIRRISARASDRLRLKVGYLAQDGADKLDARLTVAENIAEPIYSRDHRFSSQEAGLAVATLVDAVRLPLGLMSRHPYELSSGQRQRVALARALILEPQLLVADEPTRGVDVTVRQGVLDVLRELRSERGFSALIVSSDLSVIEYVSERAIVLNRGNIVGLGPINGVLQDPIHPYLKSLASSRFDKVGA